MSKTFYITTTLPYINADPHIGFAFELVSADIIARYKRLTGHEVFFNTGTDEHGLKVYRAALAEKKDPQRYADAYAEKYRRLIVALGISPDVHFVRTSESRHRKAAQAFWRRCAEQGDIYKKAYALKYCVGCELEKTESELDHSRCPIHPNLALEIIEEENYFFRLSKYQEKLLTLYNERPDFVIPAFRLNEVRSLISGKGLEDFSISRLKEKMPWGVSVPDDDAHVMYVWFDALVNYISSIGWPDDAENFEKWWPVVQFAGKDQVRQQAVMWQAMLMSAGLPPSRQIVIHGFITSDGEKMSKSLGNVIDPFALVKEYGTDAVRWYLARHIHPFEDSDFTPERFTEAYNADLANGIGNLVSRIMQLSQTHLHGDIHRRHSKSLTVLVTEQSNQEYVDSFAAYEIHRAAGFISAKAKKLDERIAIEVPYQTVKLNQLKGQELISALVHELYDIGILLLPLLPETARKIMDTVNANRKPENLFPRK